MEKDLRRLLYETIGEVFEKMFFTFLDMPEDCAQEPDKSEPLFMEANISLTAREQGWVRFYFPEALARHITVNFLGIEAHGLDEKKIRDTLGEAVNMTLGSLLGRIDPQAICGTIGIPEVHALQGVSVGDVLANPEVIAFHSEFGWLLMEFGLLKACFGLSANP